MLMCMISSATQQRILITKKLLILHAFRLYAQADFLIERQKNARMLAYVEKKL